MKLLVTLIFGIVLNTIISAQVAHDPTTWNVLLGTEKLDIFNPENEELTATVTIEIGEKEYSKEVVVAGGDWKPVTYAELGFYLQTNYGIVLIL